MTDKLTTGKLIEALATDRTKGFVERLSAQVIEQLFDLDQLIDLTFHTDKQIGFRAAWLLDTVMTARPNMYLNNLPYFVKRMADVTNESCKRHYTRIMLTVTGRKAPAPVRDKMSGIDMDDVVEKCFDWLIDPAVKVAVKVFAADVLFNLSHRYDWIAEELANQVTFLMRDGGPAIQSRGKKLLAAVIQK